MTITCGHTKREVRIDEIEQNPIRNGHEIILNLPILKICNYRDHCNMGCCEFAGLGGTDKSYLLK